MSGTIATTIPNAVDDITFIVKFLEREAPVFFLVAARVFGLTLQAPFFSAKSVPAQVRAVFITAFTLMYMIIAKPDIKGIPSDYIMYAFAMIQEALVGILFGFCISIIVSAIQAAGEIIDVQMGMSMVMLFNPQTKSQSSAMGRMFYQIQLTLFIMAHGHLYLLAAFFDTFDTVPIGTFVFNNPGSLNTFILIAGKIFYIAMKVSLPILVVLFVIDFSLGITNKVSPQINVLELNFAMKPTTGMIILLILLSTLVNVISEYTGEMIQDGVKMMKVISVQNKIRTP